MTSSQTVALLDFSGIKVGGGVQLSLNFLEELAAAAPADLDLRFLFPESGALALHAKTVDPARRSTCPASPFRRVAYEAGPLQRWIKDQRVRVVFTFFGAGIPHPKDVASVVSVAYPIICYPESPYWRNISFRERLTKRVLNIARVRRLRCASRLIAETQVMRRRLAVTLGIAEDRIVVSPPAVSTYLKPRPPRPPGTVDVLCLSGLSPHKNLWRLPEIADELLRLMPDRAAGVRFHVTGKVEEWMRSLPVGVQALASRLGSHFVWHGSVHPREIGRLYENADLLLSLSDLESFSNNYMEAWRARVPLVVSDRDFAREICLDSAVYAEPHDPAAVARAIHSVVTSPARQESMLAAGDALLARLPSRAEKMKQILDIVRAEV